MSERFIFAPGVFRGTRGWTAGVSSSEGVGNARALGDGRAWRDRDDPSPPEGVAEVLLKKASHARRMGFIIALYSYGRRCV